MHILVTGATGAIGSALIPRLLENGHEVRAGTRSPHAYQGKGTAVHFDLTENESMRRALAGCDVAYYLIHSMEASTFERDDRIGAHRMSQIAGESGCRIVYLGGLGDEQVSQRSPHLRSCHEVGRILRERPDTVELRAAIVLGRRSASFEILRQLVERLPVMVCPSWVTTRCQPIGLDDVVTYLSGALHIPAGRYDIGGPDILTYEQMMRRFARIIGKHRAILKVPMLSPGLSSRWIGLVTDQPASVARPLAEGLSVEVVVTETRIRELIPMELLDFDEAVRRVLALTP